MIRRSTGDFRRGRRTEDLAQDPKRVRTEDPEPAGALRAAAQSGEHGLENSLVTRADSQDVGGMGARYYGHTGRQLAQDEPAPGDWDGGVAGGEVRVDGNAQRP